MIKMTLKINGGRFVKHIDWLKIDPEYLENSLGELTDTNLTNLICMHRAQIFLEIIIHRVAIDQ